MGFSKYGGFAITAQKRSVMNSLGNLPTIDMRQIVLHNQQEKYIRETEFENNYQKHAYQIAITLASITLKNFQERAKNCNYEFPERSCHMEYLNLNLIETSTVYNCGPHMKSIDISPFRGWVELFSNEANKFNNESFTYYRNLMKRVNIVAESKLNDLLSDYITNPLHNILNFKVTLIEFKLSLKVWIDRESLTPLDIQQKPEESSWLDFFQKETAALPSIDMKGLGINSHEIDFEKNYAAFADRIAKEMIKNALNDFEKMLKYPCVNYPKKENPSHFSYGFNLKYYGKALEKHSFFLPPFNRWLENVNNEYWTHRYYFTDINYYQGYMNRVGVLVGEQLNEMLDDYTSRPEQDILNFETKYSETDLKLVLSLWIEEEGKWPKFSSNITNSKMPSHIPFSIQDSPKKEKSFFDMF